MLCWHKGIFSILCWYLAEGASCFQLSFLTISFFLFFLFPNRAMKLFRDSNAEVQNSSLQPPFCLMNCKYNYMMSSLEQRDISPPLSYGIVLRRNGWSSSSHFGVGG